MISACTWLACAVTAFAQDPPPVRADPDVRIDVLQPDFNLAALPTTLRVPAGKWAFRVTHRFTRPLGLGDFGDLLSNAFGLDGGGFIGLEVRYGLRSGTQMGVHRTSDRTIELFGQQSVLSERHGAALGLDARVTVEGAENLHEDYATGLGVVVSRSVGTRASLYVEPVAVLNSVPEAIDSDSAHTFLLGLGARVRVRPSLYLVGEVSPRLAGYRPGKAQVSVGIESRAGGHLFQINFSNGLGTTAGQLARGALSHDDWYLGFNIARKFF